MPAFNDLCSGVVFNVPDSDLLVPISVHTLEIGDATAYPLDVCEGYKQPDLHMTYNSLMKSPTLLLKFVAGTPEFLHSVWLRRRWLRKSHVPSPQQNHNIDYGGVFFDTCITKWNSTHTKPVPWSTLSTPQAITSLAARPMQISTIPAR